MHKNNSTIFQILKGVEFDSFKFETMLNYTYIISTISDETFGSATSGTALAFKLLPMSNLAAGYRKYKFGIVVTHDGRVFQYSAVTRPFLPDLLDGRVD